MINSWCAELCKTMAAVRTCWWQKTLSEKKERERGASIQEDSATIKENTSGTTGATMGGPINEQWDYLPPPSPKTALENILTSHLSTCCSTIVVGPDAYAINQVRNALINYKLPINSNNN